MNIGVRGHDLNCNSIASLAQRMEELGLTYVQLALKKTVQDIELNDGCFSPALAYEMKRELDRHGVHIAVLGCYINPVHPDPEVRIAQHAMFREHIRFAKYLGADMIATETGSVTPDFSPHPGTHAEENYQDLLRAMRPLVEEAAAFGVTVGVEAVSNHTISTPRKMKRFLDDIGMPNVEVILDTVNLLTYENCDRHREIIDECFDLYGERIGVLHLKDFVKGDGRLCGVLPLQGELDYPYLFSLLRKKKPGIALLTEEVKEADLPAVLVALRAL